LRYPAVGSCIYCGIHARDLPSGKSLSTEHIVPEGLAGGIELPEASCPDCAAITSAFERTCLRDIFAPARAYLDAYGKRRPAGRPTGFAVTLKSKEGTEESVHVPLVDYPFWFMMLLMPPPGILVGRTREADALGVDVNPIQISEPGHELKAADVVKSVPGAETIEMTLETKPGDLWKLLAKVGHGFAMGERGFGNFEPFLADFIRGREEHVGPHFIGGACSAENLPITSIGSSPGLHEARLLEIVSDDGRRLLVARIQLFAALGSPVYDVVVGVPR
jgi:hypothetical protein